MPWVVGIDEAGYGPNLGPLVQAGVGLYLPDDDPAGWDTVRAVVRRAHEPADGRLLVDDSKKVYARGGLAALEQVGYSLYGTVPGKLETFLRYATPESRADVRAEAWYDPAEQLPLHHTAESLIETFVKWATGYTPGTQVFRASVVPAPRFNRLCDETGSKGTILARGLISLLAGVSEIGNVGIERYFNKPVVVLCDKHGGRNFYGEMIREAFPGGSVVVERESAGESRYRVESLDRPVTVVFRPRADGESVAVALASMLCKYLREVCMLQFNRFWATHVPGIRPTAGYPTDAKRFYAEIRGAMARLGLSEDQVWRKR